MNIDAPWEMVITMAMVALQTYPGADGVIVVDDMGVTKWEWPLPTKGTE